MKLGDLVQLRSGGPAMTVTKWSEAGGWEGEGWMCVWSVQGAIREHVFPEHVLVPYDPEKPLATHTGRPKRDPGQR